MILKLIPGEVTPLPLNIYYRITLLKLHVSDNKITSCTLRIGDKDVLFSQTGEHGVLAVEGSAGNRADHTILPGMENNILLTFPADSSQLTPTAEAQLCYELSYRVPLHQHQYRQSA